MQNVLPVSQFMALKFFFLNFENVSLNLAGKNIQLNKNFFNVLLAVFDWIAFFTLGVVALVSVQGIWSDFSNTKTSLSTVRCYCNQG